MIRASHHQRCTCGVCLTMRFRQRLSKPLKGHPTRLSPPTGVKCGFRSFCWQTLLPLASMGRELRFHLIKAKMGGLDALGSTVDHTPTKGRLSGARKPAQHQQAGRRCWLRGASVIIRHVPTDLGIIAGVMWPSRRCCCYLLLLSSIEHSLHRSAVLGTLHVPTVDPTPPQHRLTGQGTASPRPRTARNAAGSCGPPATPPSWPHYVRAVMGTPLLRVRVRAPYGTVIWWIFPLLFLCTFPICNN